ncbi:hypothetical protein RN001_006961 [Aquatica leii]|uniref:Aminopeptidase P N-terminal domain-containing protein n=1 Tax=Aquatica leii TaxID=1421715 RepID=A0AAN7Q6K3_9COLE|nr:hypothetical protein RN001_006961 [Aquatica leii]
MVIFVKNLLNNRLNQLVRRYCNNLTKSKLTIKKTLTKSFGQPTAGTHPHLLNNGEVTPYIQRKEFQERRQNLIESIVAHSLNCDTNLKRHLIIIPSATKQYMSDKIPYVFRQNTDFLYLSGCLEPDTCLVLTTTESLNQHRSILFMRENDSHSELWDGPRTGLEDAIELFGVDLAFPFSELENYLEMFMKTNSEAMLWYDFLSPVQKQVDSTMNNFLNKKFNKMWESPTPFVHRLRLIKSAAEIKLMQQSCDIASDAISKTIAFSKPGVTEHQIFANVDFECKMRGAEYLAYPPVVAGGNRANIIHYINNDQVVMDKEMVLMDAGCEFHGYSSDITRTWPINGKFTSQQREIYEILLTTQQKLIELCSDFPTLDDLFESMCIILGKHLEETGLIRKNYSENTIKMVYRFCPHHVSHYLGMDVHDTSTIPRNIRIKPGMVITVEPGVYINNKMKVPEQYRGIGIRIEDDVLITNDGPVVLTKKCPRKLEDIEKLAAQNQTF